MVVDAVFGKIHRQAAHFQPIAVGALGVLGELVAHLDGLGLFVVLLQGLPCGEVGGSSHLFSFFIGYRWKRDYSDFQAAFG